MTEIIYDFICLIIAFKIGKGLGEKNIFLTSLLLVLNYYKDNVENLQANFVSQPQG